MDFLKKTIDRTKQTLDEAFGDAKTEYDAPFQLLLRKHDEIKCGTERVVNTIEAVTQPDPAARLLPGLVTDENVHRHSGHNNFETASVAVNDYYRNVSTWKDAGDGAPPKNVANALGAAKDAFALMGQAERDYLRSVNEQFMTPMKRFLNEDIKKIDTERKTLTNLRLDMDSAKKKSEKQSDDSKLSGEFKQAEAAFEGQKKLVESLIKDMLKEHQDNVKHLRTYAVLSADFHNKVAKQCDAIAKASQ